MLDSIKKEYGVFKDLPSRVRILLLTNLVYAFVLPIVELFVGAYIMRSSSDPSLVIKYQLAVYTGIPFTFLINGFLLRYFDIRKLYSLGMILSGISMLFMMELESLDTAGLTIAGFIMGASYGLFWANRDFLALETTNDNNRNYYYGIETFFYTICFIVVPLAVGAFLASTHKISFLDGNIQLAYKIITGVVFLLTLLSSYIIHQDTFNNPKQKRFIHFRFDKLWNKMMLLSSLKGLVQGYLVTAPAILIMKLLGDEGTLGTVQALSGIITAFVLYILGRVSKPSHRIYILSVGILIFLLGAFSNAVLFSASGVIVFMLCKVLFLPLHDIAYFPIQLKVIDIVSEKENRNEFSYILNHEFGLYLGRFTGLVLFILLTQYLSEDFALRYALFIVALVQVASVPLANHIIKKSKK